MLAVFRNRALPRACLGILRLVLHRFAAFGCPAASRRRFLLTTALLRNAMLTFDLQTANQILKRAVERRRVDHGLATIGASVASPLGVGQAFEAINMSICACRRRLIVNVEAKRARQIIVHWLDDEERRFEAHGMLQFRSAGEKCNQNEARGCSDGWASKAAKMRSTAGSWLFFVHIFLFRSIEGQTTRRDELTARRLR